jgi:hypothetical protein
MPFGIKQDDRLRHLLTIIRRWTAAFKIGGLERTIQATGGGGHLILDRVTQQIRGRDDAAAMNASRSAYSTDEMALSSVHSSFRNFRVLLIAFPFLAVLSVELAR